MVKLGLTSLVLGVVATFAGCGGGGDGGGAGGGPGGGGTGPFALVATPPPAGSTEPLPMVDSSGHWTGAWESENGIDAGDVSMTLAQSGRSMTGWMSFTGSPCFVEGRVTGKVGVIEVIGAFEADGIQVRFSVAGDGVDAEILTGTYSVVSGAPCAGDSGSITLARTSSTALEGDESGSSDAEKPFVRDAHGTRPGGGRGVKR